MESVYREIQAKRVYVYPIGDVHIGDKNCDYKKLQTYLDWVKESPDGVPRLVILTGDWCNVATRRSASNPHQQDLTLDDQLDKAQELLTPIAEKVLAAVCGNHEDRLVNEAGFDPMRNICERLAIPYLGYSGVIHLRLRMPRARRLHKKVPSYVIYVHHTTGGGNTIGGKINRVEKLTGIVSNADIYIGAHNHFEVLGKTGIRFYDEERHRVISRERVFIDAGGFLRWDNSYAEAKQLNPGGTGCPRIELDGKERMIQANLFVTEE